MALETGTYISDLVSSNPPQSDSLTQAAGHLRLIKAAILATFPNVTGAVTKTHTELNAAVDFIDAAQFIPAGSILPFGGSSTPTGYLLCYGQAVSRTTYSGLYTAIGTTWGVGDGSTTFNVPDLRDRVLVGKGNMGGVDAAIIDSLLTTTTLGATYDGEGAIDTITLAEVNIPAHTHSFSGSGTTSSDSHTHTFSGTTGSDSHSHGNIPTRQTGSLAPSGSSNRYGIETNYGNSTDSDSHSHSFSGTTSSDAHTHTVTISGTTGSTGSTTPFTVDILPPSAVVNYIIKT